MIYGYARVSTKEQKLDRQLNEFETCSIKIDKIYQEKASAKNFDREQYRLMIRKLKKGDVVVISSLDRLGRNYDELLKEWQLITQIKQADIIVLDMPILNTKSQVDGLDGKFISNLVLQILSYVAQKEREKIKERQAQGIKVAMEKGIKFGRPKVSLDCNQIIIIKNYMNGHYKNSQSAIKDSGLSRGTFFRNLVLLKGELKNA